MSSTTKKWTLKSKNDKKLDFYPHFIVDEKNNQVVCDIVTIKEGENKYILNYLDLLVFVYEIGGEEDRRKLARINLKQITEIPFDVTFKISNEEKGKGIAKRRVMLPVDQLIIYLAKGEAKKMAFLKNLNKK